MKTINLFAIALTVIALATFTTSCLQDEVVAPVSHDAGIDFDQTGSSASLLTAPDILYGKPIKEYTKDWWSYVTSLPPALNPLNPTATSAPKVSQIGPVQDLFGVKNGSVTRTIDAVYNKPIIVPVINTIKTYPSTDLNAKPVLGQSVDQFLRLSADNFIKMAVNVSVRLDGKQMSADDIKRLTTDLFAIKGNKDLVNFLDLGITGKDQSALSDGFWFVAKDLSKGQHTLVTHAEVPGKRIITDVTYNINVR